VPASWFVKTRGSRADEDYTWRPVTAGNPDDAGEISERGWKGHPCFSLLDDEQPGMLLFDDEKTETVLLVSGLVSPDRPLDYQRRAIRVSLLGVAAHHEPDQHSLVAVAVRALRDGLVANLPVSYGDTGGFAVEEARWSRFIELAIGELSDVTGVRPDPEKIKVRRDTEEERHKIANELSALYLQAGPSVLTGKLTILRTNLLDAPEIGRLKPWRTISEVADAPVEAFVSGANPISEMRANAGKFLGAVMEEINRHRILFAALALAGIAAVTAVVLSLGDSPDAGHSSVAPNTPAGESPTSLTSISQG
jgi:hypothetical protein